MADSFTESTVTGYGGNIKKAIGLALLSMTLATPTLADDEAQQLPSQQIGDAKVEVTSVRISKPSVRTERGGKKLSKTGLIVSVKLTNVSGSTTMKYDTWNFPVESTAKVAKVVDDTGKQLATFEAWPYYGGITKRTNDVRPGKWVRDMLVFESPSPNAKNVTLELPGESVGSTGVHKLIIPLPRTSANSR